MLLLFIRKKGALRAGANPPLIWRVTRLGMKRTGQELSVFFTRE
ncbi:hypothetical protein LTSEINV_1187 [Salmonella enterica subsp. enterica serovar Inverness str. R8-3668]|uniref:Uncharacterized protein n=1 Tax=Salmonella enterica subsp. enterica serovar Inverness str. R8-3668 TaxID=913075 RepID=G5N9U0_SALET|nr:hypothetical protein LTSEINV_1187 [Salmonella enterica subsp. enterica serovar Inverness str. R8-3668]